MEIKQLEYFLAACDCGSFNKAAERLFTAQPNVSKVITAFEKELGYPLFVRTPKGLVLTDSGKTIKVYAEHIIQHVSMMQGLSPVEAKSVLNISTYVSNMLANLLTDFYIKYPDIKIRHQQGSVEEITDQVSSGESELGIVYVSKKQINSFKHIISHKRLEYFELDSREACLYVGPNHPLYGRDSIDFCELKNLKFLTGTHDYFSMEHHLEQVSMGALRTDQLNFNVHTNSDHLTINLLLKTDACSFGLDFIYDKYATYKIKPLKIRNCDPFLSIGYVKMENHELSAIAADFVSAFKKML